MPADAIQDPLVIFTPSGKRGRFPVGTPVLSAARALGVDLDSVCGGRGICSKCQITPGYGDFPKHGVSVGADALSPWNAVEQRYKDKRGLTEGRRLGCQARISGDVVIDVPPESQVHKQVIRKSADARAVAMDPATRRVYVEVAEPDMHEPSGDFQRLAAALGAQWGIAGAEPAPGLLPRLQGILRKGGWAATAIVHADHRGASGGSGNRRGARLGRGHEPADPFWRGSDEPGELCDDEPGRRRRDDGGGARGAR